MTEHAQTKERILRFLRINGPLLPVHIAKEINQSILFTSAFLSELLSEKEIKMSNLRVGSSPIYFLPGQEFQLEKYSDNIKGKEKEAYLLIKEKKFLDDAKQESAIRVAIRAIKDFAIPFIKENQLFWRYFTIPESEFENSKEKSVISISITKELEKEKDIKQEDKLKQKDLDVFDKKPKQKNKSKISKSPKKSAIKNKISEKSNEKFFDRVKEFLSGRNIEILGIEGFSKNNLVVKVKENNQEKIIIAYNKKKITETDIINAHKKSLEFNFPYIILSLGEPTKKIVNLMNALKNISKIEKIE